MNQKTEQSELSEAVEYIRQVDEQTGRIFHVDPRTGEAVEYYNVDIEVGSKIITPKGQAQAKEIRDRQAAWAVTRYRNKEAGGFFFVNAAERFEDISFKAVARLMFLAAHMNFDGTIMLNRKRKMTVKDLPHVLRLSRSSVQRFVAAVSPKYITIHDDRTLSIASEAFFRGELKRKQFTRRQIVFLDGVKALYQAATPSDHKWLGAMFTVLPYVNAEYNLLCYPECVGETELKHIRPLPLGEFCNLIGFDQKHIGNLTAAIRRLRFTTDGEDQPFCYLNPSGEYGCLNDWLMVNPKVFYAGTSQEKVSVLVKMYEKNSPKTA